MLEGSGTLALTTKYKKLNKIIFLLKKRSFGNKNYITSSSNIDK